MSRWVSTYSEPSLFKSTDSNGTPYVFTCEPGGEVFIPDAFDRLIPSHCPGWKLKAAEAEKPAEPVKPQQSGKDGKR